jgi:hypothetical protein
MTREWIAAADFVAVHADGTRTALRVGVGAPRLSGAEEWKCALALDGLYDRLPAVSGGDSLQALGLAWQLAGRLLASFEAQGGHLEFENGETVPLSVYFDQSTGAGSDPAI